MYLYNVSASGHATDVRPSPVAWEAVFRESRSFTRGWTLQELIALASVEFFSREGERPSSKKSLEQDIHDITGIATEALRGGSLTDFEVEERLSWVNHRATKRQEDKAYSLLGSFNGCMPLLYGEGRDKAFVRLEEEIKKSLNHKWPFPSTLATLTTLHPAPVEQTATLPSPSSAVPFRRDVDFVDRGAFHGCGTLLEHIKQRYTAAASRVALVGIGGAG